MQVLGDPRYNWIMVKKANEFLVSVCNASETADALVEFLKPHGSFSRRGNRVFMDTTSTMPSDAVWLANAHFWLRKKKPKWLLTMGVGTLHVQVHNSWKSFDITCVNGSILVGRYHAGDLMQAIHVMTMKDPPREVVFRRDVVSV